MTPFGALAALVQRRALCKGLEEDYPGLNEPHSTTRVQATCDFLHDFVLDLKPLDQKTDAQPASSDEVAHEKAELDLPGGTPGERDIESARISVCFR